jgi:hypothetical protein
MRAVAQDDKGWNREQGTDADGQHRISGVDDPHDSFDAIAAGALADCTLRDTTRW